MNDQVSMDDEDFSDLKVDLINNREERLPCILVVDGSGSMMKNDAIGELNRGIAGFAEALKRDPVASMRVQVKVIRFGGTVDDMDEWADALAFDAPEIRAAGNTPMGEAVEKAMDLAEKQLAYLKSQNIDRKRPWIWLLSDGLPTDPGWEAVARKACEAQQAGKFFLYPVSVITEEGESSHTAALKSFNMDGQCIQIQGAEFEAFFKFVSTKSMEGSKKEGIDTNVFSLANFS